MSIFDLMVFVTYIILLLNDSAFTDCRIIYDQAHLSHFYPILRGSLANKLLYYMFTTLEYTNLPVKSLGGCVSLAWGLV